ncbi:MAG TPA: hypothetical protein VHY75_12905 [Steroidobacteraceae bacterium]|nr:hypothetical protein [Steroidobacteraceae bacterium]
MSKGMSEGMSNGSFHRVWGLALCAAILAGCATQPPSPDREIRLGDRLNIYDMYDNSRPWGASYLVGPPAHHLGDESRIDDLRSAPSDTSAADPNKSPSSSAPAPTLTDKPLPLLP